MKNKTRKILITTIVILAMYTYIGSVMAAIGPTIELDPNEPAPQSTVTFTVTIPSEGDLDEVVILVEECKAGLCFFDSFNESMTMLNTDIYTTQITLKHGDAIEMKYRLGYSSDGTWKWEPPLMENMTSVPLASEQNNGNSNGGNDDTNGTPGFEVIGILISAIFILLILNKRKR